MSTAPTVLLGLVPLIRAVVRSETTDTATTVTADDSGTLFVNLGTSKHTYTLPTLALGKGKSWVFFNADGTAAIAIVSGTASKLKTSDTAVTTVTETNHEVGGCMLVICDGTWFYCLEIYGTWTGS